MKRLQNLILRFLCLLIFFAPACGPTYYYTTDPVTGKREMDAPSFFSSHQS